MKTQHTKHVTYKLRYHAIRCPKYRKQLLVGPVAALVEQTMREMCQRQQWEIGELNIQYE